MVEYVRKVQRIGRSSFFITLPKAWAERYGVKENDRLVLSVLDDGSILVTKTGVEGRGLAITVNASGRPLELVKKEIVYAYLNGYSTITIESADRDTLREVKRFVLGRLEGLILVEEGDERHVYNFVIDYRQVKYREMLDRASRIIDYMCQEIDSPRVVRGYEDELNRLYFLSVRVLREALINPEIERATGLSSIEILDHRLVLHLLESLGDELNHLAGRASPGSLAPVLSYKSVAIDLFLGRASIRYEDLLSRRDEALRSIGAAGLEKAASRIISIIDDIVDLSIRPL